MAANKRAGKKSLAQNDFLQPAAPINVVATDVGTARPFDNGAATVTFSLPAGSPPATSYTARAFCSKHQVFHSATGASSPLTVTGFGSDIDVIFTVTATNEKGTSAASAEAASIKITTVPATPTAPSVSSPSAGTDSVSWTAPANGGKAITNYRWTASDGKAGDTASTSVSVGQEQGSAQTYNVYATNANGNSGTSPSSASVTTAFAFFGVFSFFGVFGFYYYWFNFSVAANTQIFTAANGYKKASELSVGDELVAIDLSSTKTTDSWLDWSITDPSILDGELTTTTITSIDVSMHSEYIFVDGELFTKSHFILTRKDGVISFTRADMLDTTYEKYSYSDRAFVPVSMVDNVEIAMEKVSIQCEPHDNFFTDKMLVLDQPDEYLPRNA